MTAACPCQHCDTLLEFDAENFEPGMTIECPHCQMETMLFIQPGTQMVKLEPVATPTVLMSPDTKSIGRVETIPSKSPVGALLKLIGIILIFLFGIQAVENAAMMSMALNQTWSTEDAKNLIVGSFFMHSAGWFVLTIIGVLIFRCGTKLSKKFICSECGNPVDSKNVKICPVCRVDLDIRSVTNRHHLKSAL
jgi:DNA-directed RNA polymerase subunit RPC12/RpoP